MVIAGAVRIASVAKRLSVKYKYLNPTDKFIRKYVPPNYRGKATRIARYGEIATTGGVIYDVISEIGNALQKPQQNAPGQQYQTYNRQSRRTRSGYKNRYNPDKRCRCPKHFNTKRSRYWR